MQINTGRGWLLFLEVCVGISWTVLQMGWMERESDRLAVVLVSFLMTASGAAMFLAIHRNNSARTAKTACGGILLAGTAIFFFAFGFHPFTFAMSVVTLVTFRRIQSILFNESRLDEVYRRFFVVDSWAIPLVSAVCFVKLSANGIVPPLAAAAAVGGLLFIRLASLRAVQQLEGHQGRQKPMEILVPVGMMSAVILAFAVFPYVAYVISWVAVPIVYVLSPWIERLQSFHASREQTGKDGLQPEADNRMQDDPLPPFEPITLEIPSWVWGAAMLLFIGFFVLKWIRNMVAPSETDGAAFSFHIHREQWAPPSAKLRYQTTDSVIRLSYQRMLKWLEEKGRPIQMHETPKEYAERMLREGSLTAKETYSVCELTDVYELKRYGDANTSKEADERRKAENAIERIIGQD